MNNSLLPANATSLERNLSQTLAQATDLPVPIRQLWNPATCPKPLLTWLAWSFSVDEWNPNWGEDVQRRVIEQSVQVHRRKGTRGAVRRALEAYFGEIAFVLVEGASAGLYDGSGRHNEANFYGQAEHWAKYSVYIAAPISLEMAADVRSILASIAPARCHLHAINFQEALNAYDGAIYYDNTFTHGIA